MNLSALLSRLKPELSIYMMALPIKNEDEFLVNTIKNTTLRTYSQYFPMYAETTVTAEDISKAGHVGEWVEVPMHVRDDEEIVFVDSAEYDGKDLCGMGYLGNPMPLFGSNNVQDMILSNLGMQFSNQMIPKLNWEFKYPRTLRLFWAYAGGIIIHYAKLHDPSLTSVPFSQEESFYKLAKLDIQNVLYQLMKHYNEIQTAHGTVNLHIEDLQEAQSKREDIIREWDEIYHLEQKSVYWSNGF